VNRGKKGIYLILLICLFALNIYIFKNSNGSNTHEQPDENSLSHSDPVLSEINFLGSGIDSSGFSVSKGSTLPVELGAGSVDIYCKDKYQLVPLSGSALSWSTSDEAIATVDINGRISTHAAGSAVITATDPNGNSDSCMVNVIKVVYLTIDDVPDDITMKILDILDEHDITATFFFNADERKTRYYQEVYQRGHAFALHGYKHNTTYKNTDTFLKNMEDCRDFLVRTTGCRPDYVENVLRFPTGSKGSKCYEKIVTQIQERGYSAFDWTTEFHDYTYSSAEKCLEYFKTYLTHDRDIFLFHSRPQSLAALPDAIDHIIKSGYTFAPITEYTAQYNFRGRYVDN